MPRQMVQGIVKKETVGQFSNGVISASEIQSLKIIKYYITGKLFLL